MIWMRTNVCWFINFTPFKYIYDLVNANETKRYEIQHYSHNAFEFEIKIGRAVIVLQSFYLIRFLSPHSSSISLPHRCYFNPSIYLHSMKSFCPQLSIFEVLVFLYAWVDWLILSYRIWIFMSFFFWSSRDAVDLLVKVKNDYSNNLFLL